MQSEEEEEEVDGARETTQVEAVVEVYILKGLKGLFSFLFADESFFFFRFLGVFEGENGS